MTIGERINRARKDRGLTQEKLAEMMGVSSQAVSKWENDQSYPDITTLPKLGEILGMSMDEILSGKKNEIPGEVQMVPEEDRKDWKERVLRIVCNDDGDKVRVNIPMTLVAAAIEMGVGLGDVSMGGKNLNQIDIEKIMKLVQAGMVGNLVEVEEESGATVRIFVE